VRKGDRVDRRARSGPCGIDNGAVAAAGRWKRTSSWSFPPRADQLEQSAVSVVMTRTDDTSFVGRPGPDGRLRQPRCSFRSRRWSQGEVRRRGRRSTAVGTASDAEAAACRDETAPTSSRYHMSPSPPTSDILIICARETKRSLHFGRRCLRHEKWPGCTKTR